MMWIAVAVASVWAPDFVAWSNDGSHTTIPSGIFVALFATTSTWRSRSTPSVEHETSDDPSGTNGAPGADELNTGRPRGR